MGELVLDPPQSSGDLAGPPHLDEDYLVLSTVHSAKGLEWQAVHVLALYDGNFPADMAAGSSEEHRRGAAAVLRRDDARPPPAAPVRAGALLPPADGRDDAHGLGKPSRFLTARCRGCARSCGRPRKLALPRGPDGRPRRITVSVDSLFE